MTQLVNTSGRETPVTVAPTSCSRRCTSSHLQQAATSSIRGGNSSLAEKMNRLNQLIMQTKTMLERMEAASRLKDSNVMVLYTWPSVIHAEYAEGRAERGILSAKRHAKQPTRVSKMRSSGNTQCRTSGISTSQRVLPASHQNKCMNT